MTGFWTPRLNQSIFNVQGKQGAIVDPPDGNLPYTPAAAAKAKDLKANHMFDETEAHCFQSGVPHTAYQQFGYQILHNNDYVAFMPEYAHSYRVIPTDNRKHIPADVKLFMGDGVGHWEGDTLVVETEGTNGQTWIDTAEHPHSDALRIVERYTRPDFDHIVHEVTISDAKYLTKPMTNTSTFVLMAPGTELYEYSCEENNKEIMEGRITDEFTKK